MVRSPERAQRFAVGPKRTPPYDAAGYAWRSAAIARGPWWHPARTGIVRSPGQPLAPAPRFAARLKLRTAGPRVRTGLRAAKESGPTPGSVQDSQSSTDTEAHGTQVGRALGAGASSYRFRVECASSAPVPWRLRPQAADVRQSTPGSARNREDPTGMDPARAPNSRVRAVQAIRGPTARGKATGVTSMTVVQGASHTLGGDNAARIAPVPGPSGSSGQAGPVAGHQAAAPWMSPAGCHTVTAGGQPHAISRPHRSARSPHQH